MTTRHVTNGPSGKNSSRPSAAPLPGWLAIPFLLLASVCGATPERGREASLDLQRLGRGSVHVSGELLEVDARRNLALEHDADGVARTRASLSELGREVSDEGGAR